MVLRRARSPSRVQAADAQCTGRNLEGKTPEITIADAQKLLKSIDVSTRC
jgi:hypothetical protein